MKKSIYKIISVIICLLITLSFTSCNEDDGEKIDPTKTQLYIGNYNGGLGYTWLQKAGDLFEEKYANVSFQSGKTGVQIMIDNNKDNYTGTQLMSSIKTARQDVYFTQDVNYYDAVANNLFADISDIVTEKFDSVDLGEGVKTYSVEDKLSSELKNYFKVDGKYYGLPFASPIYGIVYDVDLFNQKRLYFLANGEVTGSKDKGDVLSAGSDGIQGTYDDGLPATWEQFKVLMRKMIERGLTPFTWSGLYTYQRQAFLQSVWVSYEGYNDFMLNNSFSGTTDAGVEINNTNGYLLASQEGKLAALTAAYDIVSDTKDYSDNAFKTSQTHTGAQEEYLFSTVTDKPIAMLLEGGYWENEAKGTFGDMVTMYGSEYAYGTRRFGYMPIPKFIGTQGVTDQTNTKTALNSRLNATCFINASTSKMKLAKFFLQYTCSNEALSIFNVETGTTRNFNYVISAENYAKCLLMLRAFTIYSKLRKTR